MRRLFSAVASSGAAAASAVDCLVLRPRESSDADDVWYPNLPFCSLAYFLFYRSALLHNVTTLPRARASVRSAPAGCLPDFGARLGSSGVLFLFVLRSAFSIPGRANSWRVAGKLCGGGAPSCAPGCLAGLHDGSDGPPCSAWFSRSSRGDAFAFSPVLRACCSTYRGAVPPGTCTQAHRHGVARRRLPPLNLNTHLQKSSGSIAFAADCLVWTLLGARFSPNGQ